MDELALGITAFCKRMGLGRTKTYQLIVQGELEVLKAGRKTLITTRSIEAWMSRCSTKVVQL